MKMMKSVAVVIVFLNMLHLCLGNNLRSEILKDLNNLTQENFTLPKQYRVPAKKMMDNALQCGCQRVFATELKLVVSEVKARTEEHKPLLNRLRNNIQNLPLPQISTPEEASICPMRKQTLRSSPKFLWKYILFLQNLNENECGKVTAEIQ